MDRTRKIVTVALVGNPNSGKTTLFNRLTGAKAPVGNYPRVTLTPHRREISHRGWTLSVVETVALSGDGFETLLDAEVAAAEAATEHSSAKITYDSHLEQTIARVSGVIDQIHAGGLDPAQCHWLSIKLLEGDDEVLTREGEHTQLIEQVRRERTELARNHGEEVDTMIADARYGFIHGLLEETRTMAVAAGGSGDLTQRLDPCSTASSACRCSWRRCG